MAKNPYIQGDVVMSSRDITSVDNYADMHLQPIRKLYITVEIIDKDGNTIETIQGLSTGGGLSVSNSSLIRRTGNLSFVLFDDLLPKRGKLLWMTNKIRVYAGLEDMSKGGSMTHFCLGTFFISEPEIDISKDNRSIAITLEDNMMRWEQEFLENKIKIVAGTPLNTAVTELMNLYGEFNTDIGFTDLTVPYTLEFNEGESVLDILTKLRDLYMDWECYYDTDGRFVFKRMSIQREDGEPIAWNFVKGSETDLATIFKENFTYKEVKNRVVVIGQMNDKTGVTPKAEVSIAVEDSPFHYNEIGVKTKVIVDSSYGNNIQCDARARYELFKCSTFQEKSNINTIPIYFLDVNDIIEVTNFATGESERWVIDSISLGLSIEEEMQMSCHKVYYDYFEVDSSLGEYKESAEIIIDGITNKGWLSLSEGYVSQYLGLEGDGSKLIVKFEYNGINGVTAYVTGYVGEKVQSLTIDLADFDHPTGDNGDTGRGKAEYSDRILGHEMVHAVMNNQIGVEKSINLPSWFKEGIAEYVHGADERLKINILTGGTIDQAKLQNIVDIATTLLNGGTFLSDTNYYSAGYLICKYLDTRWLSGKSMKNLMWSLQNATNSTEMLKNAIVENANFTTYDAFVTNLSANLYNHVIANLDLNEGTDELDTGSIAGSDGQGSTSLNAENVFNNTNATAGIASTGFTVEFIRP